MKQIFISFIVLISIPLISPGQAIISEALQSACNKQLAQGEYLGVVVYMKQQVDIASLELQFREAKTTRSNRAKILLRELQEMANKTQLSLLSDLQRYDSKYLGQIKSIKSYWVRNAIYVECRTPVVGVLAMHPDVLCMDLNYGKFYINEPYIEKTTADKSTSAPEPGILAINAPALWAMGYTGRNTILLSMDTGVWTDHPALADAYLGKHFPLSQVWYGVRSVTPVDHASSSHGTHTTGTVLGLDPATSDTIGVAYNAYFMATDPVASSNSDLLAPTDFMDVFQWVLDPDENAETTEDMPDVINNSWGYDYNLAILIGACEMQEAEILEVIETAGICSPFSAGNEGPGASTNGFPAMLAYNLVNPMSIGAVNGNNENYPIADFSSRGPTPCVAEEGPLQIKPEVVAPGMSVRSASGHNEYSYLSGTSMACPHVSGALLLLREAFPEASAYELKYALYITASDLGEEGEDNTYGRGMIDVLEAFNYLSETYVPVAPVTNEYNITAYLSVDDDIVLCNENAGFTPNLIIKNTGTETIAGIQVSAKYNTLEVFNEQLYAAIAPGDSIVINLPEMTGVSGRNEIFASANNSNSELREYNIYDNNSSKVFYVLGYYETQYSQNFDTISNALFNSDWIIKNSDMNRTWDIVRWDTDNDNRALNMNFYNYIPRQWQSDDALMPEVQLPDTGNITLRFEYAYKKRMETLFKDSLIVLLSTDCGESFSHELWRNGGVDLATVAGNAGSSTYIPTSSADFDTVSIDLNQFGGNTISIAFRAKNDGGGSLFIDNVSITTVSNSQIPVMQTSKPFLLVYPNPASDKVFIETNINSDCLLIEVIDATGKLLHKYQAHDQASLEIDTRQLDSGIYFVRLSNKQVCLMQRFTKL